MPSKNDQPNAQKPPSSTALLVLTPKIPDRGTDSGRNLPSPPLFSSRLCVPASFSFPGHGRGGLDPLRLLAAQTPSSTSYQQSFARASRPVDLSGSAQSLAVRCAPLNYA